MRALFLNPPFIGRFSRTSRSPAVAKGGTLYYPIWLAYAAGTVEAAGFEVSLLDAPAAGLGLDEVLDRVSRFGPDLVVLDTSTASIASDIAVAEKVKSARPGAFIVLVGTHPSALPEDTLRRSASVDAVAVGEYDFTLRDLAKSLASGGPLEDVDGLVFRNGEAVVSSKPRAKIEDLDALPFVSSVYKKHLNHRDYFFAAAAHPMLMTITGRGCPYRCFFCVYPQVIHGRRYRKRSPENVVAEFEYIAANFPDVREIGLEDDCFSADRDRVARICELMIRRGPRLQWYCNVRGDLDYELLRLMRSAGCRLVTVGFESGCQDVLDGIHKGEKTERYRQFARDARRAGILVHGCIMVGNPGDSRETLARSYEFAKELNCDSMQFYPLYVYPGTEAYAWAKENGYLETEDFSRWVDREGLHNCVLSFPGLSSREMVGLCDHYLKKYHLRPAYIAMKLKQALFSPSEGLRSMQAARIFFSKLLRGQLGNDAWR